MNFLQKLVGRLDPLRRIKRERALEAQQLFGSYQSNLMYGGIDVL